MLRLFNPRRKKLTLNRFLQLGLFLPVIWLIVGNTQEIRYAAMDTWNKIQMIMEQGVQITIRPRSVTPVAEPPFSVEVVYPAWSATDTEIPSE